MSATEPLVRYKHIPLSTQQRRLRHLRSIAVRNIVSKSEDDENCDLTQVETFFTLHISAQAPAFYTSEKISGTLNPTWRSFTLEHLGDTLGQKPENLVNNSQTFTIVRIWRGAPQNVRLCIEWSVHFSGLLYLGEKAQREGVHYPPNTVLFGILDGIYSIARAPSPGPETPVRYQLQVDEAMVRRSYSTQTLLRVKTVLRAIKQTQASVNRVKTSIEGKLLHSQSLKEKRSQRESQSLKNNMMHSDLEWRALTLRAQKEALDEGRTENRDNETCLLKQFALLQKERDELHDKKKKYFDVREELIKTGAQLVLRRKQLISELAFIYPIVETPALEYNICGVRLPHSEDFAGQDEVMIAVGLGYTCHLVQMISHFLDVPLRYPMIHEGSRSMIRDHIIDKLTERERDFPLFSKGREKFQFNYGVYLINKNIAQLRFYCTLGTTDLRLTLPNLKSLLELRLGVKFESANVPVFESQHLAVPPNLGGPQSSSKMPTRLLSEESTPETSTESVDISVTDETTGDQTEHTTQDNDTTQQQRYSSQTTDDVTQTNGPQTVIIEGQLDNAINEILHSAEEICDGQTKPNLNLGRELSAERLLASYEEIDASSTEDNASATYNSSFKLWSEDALPSGERWPGEKDSDVATVTTFKTKAMMSPTTPDNDIRGTCDDLLTQASNCADKLPRKPDVQPFVRERTDSGTDSEESATFVVPGNRPLLQPSLLPQHNR